MENKYYRLYKLLKDSGAEFIVGVRSCGKQHYENERKKKSYLVVETKGLDSLYYGLADMLINTEEDDEQ